MKREIRVTGDGSSTIHIPDLDEQYHSKHGAINEAYHVFIAMGFDAVSVENTRVLEVGFGTGLNSFITLLEAEKQDRKVSYVGVEAYPVTPEEVSHLNYVETLDAAKHTDDFKKMHEGSWEEAHQITPHFLLTKRQQKFADIVDDNAFDLIYYDAFGSRVQPELWGEEIFAIMYKALAKDGVLVTYAAKGSARRAMQAVGFEVERLPGPPAKREMLRATKK